MVCWPATTARYQIVNRRARYIPTEIRGIHSCAIGYKNSKHSQTERTGNPADDIVDCRTPAHRFSRKNGHKGALQRHHAETHSGLTQDVPKNNGLQGVLMSK